MIDADAKLINGALFVGRERNIITAAAASVTIQSITRHSSLTHTSRCYIHYTYAERTDFYFRNNGPPLVAIHVELSEVSDNWLSNVLTVTNSYMKKNFEK